MTRYRAVIEFETDQEVDQFYFLPWIASKYDLEDGYDAEWRSLEVI